MDDAAHAWYGFNLTVLPKYDYIYEFSNWTYNYTIFDYTYI